MINKFKFFLIGLILSISPSLLVAQIKEVNIEIKEYVSQNDFHKSVRVKTTNNSNSIKNGTVTIRSNNLEVIYAIKLQPSEKKIIDIPFIAKNNWSQVFVKFDRDAENSYINERDAKTFNKGVLEIKAPNKGQLLFKYGNVETLEEKTFIERIDLQELPNNPLCLFQYQVIVIPSEVELALNSEQFQILKTFVGFGGKILYLDSEGKLPARWKSITLNGLGEVQVAKTGSSGQIDFFEVLGDSYFDAIPMFFKKNFSFESHNSPKGFYLIIVLVFIVFIGPVNFYFLHKKNKKFLIFITSPLLALIFSTLLILAFFIKEGFYKRYEGQSMTIIDSQNNQAILNLKNSVYFSTISGEFERDRNGIYFPLNENHRQSEFVNTVGSKAMLSGNFAKARSANEFGEIKIFECHSKIVLRKDGSKIFAKNGFGTKQTILIVDCRTHKYYHSKVAVEPDQEVLLEPVLVPKEDLFRTTEIYTGMSGVFFNLANQRSEGYLYFAYAATNEFVPFREKEGFLQGENGHTIMGVINQ